MSHKEHKIALSDGMDEILTIPEVCQILKVSRATVRRYIQNASLKAYKLHTSRKGAVRILRRDLVRFVIHNALN
jgi:excisionase family DNA binding protein